MPTHRRHRISTGLSAVLVACLAAAALPGPVAAAPDPDKAAARAERNTEQQAAKAERDAAKADRVAEREARKAELEATKAERVELREQRKAELEARKADAKALRAEARAAITALRDGFSDMSVDERQATLDEIRGVRDGYQVLFLVLMDTWRADRDELLPNTLSDESEADEDDVETEAVEGTAEA